MRDARTTEQLNRTLERAAEIAQTFEKLRPQQQLAAYPYVRKQFRTIFREISGLKATDLEKTRWYFAREAVTKAHRRALAKLEGKPRSVRLVLAGAFEMNRRRH